MPNLKPKLDWCFRKEKLRTITRNNKKTEEHLEKAKHNLKAADYNIRGGFSDWAVSQAYYAMYHGLLAVLYKFGLESVNHECTIIAVENLIEQKKIKLDVQDIAFIRTTEQMTSKDAKSLREEFQYGTKTEVNKKIMDELLNRSKEVIEKIEIALSEIE